jgi:hypothetical protein
LNVTFPSVSPDVMRAAQVVTAFTMAAFLATRFVPKYAATLRVALLVAYLVTVVGFCLYVALGMGAPRSL